MRARMIHTVGKRGESSESGVAAAGLMSQAYGQEGEVSLLRLSWTRGERGADSMSVSCSAGRFRKSSRMSARCFASNNSGRAGRSDLRLLPSRSSSASTR